MSIGTKKTIAAAVGWLAFFAALCVVDGMDRFIVPIGRGAALVFGLTAVWAFGLYKAGFIRLPGPQPGEAGADRRGEAGRTREQGRTRRCEMSGRASARGWWIRWRR